MLRAAQDLSCDTLKHRDMSHAPHFSPAAGRWDLRPPSGKDSPRPGKQVQVRSVTHVSPAEEVDPLPPARTGATGAGLRGHSSPGQWRLTHCPGAGGTFSGLQPPGPRHGPGRHLRPLPWAPRTGGEFCHPKAVSVTILLLDGEHVPAST